ncbi:MULTISPECIES: membrane protein insertion efficiency factor YidD [unclassified Caballeronia]|jgi:putative membrane protein insertion efficiency factor|uniref:membrane protein insertion efficiency factor YidD n=1 Tax=Caballeronia sp. GAWG1-5s-s TaxID=2921743 RepID=UPI002029A40D|nr:MULTISPECIES: membrane protein insertion efficiency factor YidD [unclassified Caballeronia]
MQTALIALLRFYKVAISPLLGNRCRFYPSCSDYAREAIQYHGAAHGTYLAAKRLCRCHPFSAGGVDLVPTPSRAPGSSSASTQADSPAAGSAQEKHSPLNGAKALTDRH